MSPSTPSQPQEKCGTPQEKFVGSTYSQNRFRNQVETQQLPGIIKYFLAAEEYSENKKARQQHGTQN